MAPKTDIPHNRLLFGKNIHGEKGLMKSASQGGSQPPFPLANAAASPYSRAMTQHERLLIIDFGSQVTQLIARRLRELNVYCEIHPFNKVTDAFLADFAPKAVILSGGPSSVFAEGAPMPPLNVFKIGVPVLGICYGQQVMMHCHHRRSGAQFLCGAVPPRGAPHPKGRETL